MTLIQWIRTQDTRDTVELLRRINAPGAQTGTTAPQLVDVYDGWEKQRIKTAKAVYADAGLTKQEIIDVNVTVIATKISNWINGLAAAARPLATIRASAFFALLFEKLAVRNVDVDEDAQVDQGSKPIYGPSVAQENGWGTVTGNDIEAVLRAG